MNIGERFPETVTRAGTVPPATGYSLVGPSSGLSGVASTNFAVFLTPFGSSVAGTVTVTPSDGGAGGTFTPASVGLTTASPSATFTYTPASTGTKTISVTNNGGLPDPASRTYAVSGPPATGYSLSGPSGGAVGVASTNFTVALTPSGGSVSGAVTITPTDLVAGGVFTPATVDLTTAAPSATFTYTPGIAGTRTISCSNNKGLTDPGNLSYAASAGFDPTTIAGLKLWLKADSLALSDGAAISTWPDSSSNANNATQSTPANQPIFKTNIVNGKPVVRTIISGPTYLALSPGIATNAPWVVFVVFRVASSTDLYGIVGGSGQITGPYADVGSSSMNVLDQNGSSNVNNTWTGAFHVFTGKAAAGVFPALWVDGNLQTVTSIGHSATGNFDTIAYGTGDVAEILLYSTSLSVTDRQNVENYLKAKYGL